MSPFDGNHSLSRFIVSLPEPMTGAKKDDKWKCCRAEDRCSLTDLLRSLHSGLISHVKLRTYLRHYFIPTRTKLQEFLRVLRNVRTKEFVLDQRTYSWVLPQSCNIFRHLLTYLRSSRKF